MARAVMALVVTWIAADPASLAWAVDPSERPARFLQQERNLEKANVGDVWLSAGERRVRDDFNRLPQWARNVVSLQNELDERIRQNRQVWETNQVRIGQLRQLKSTRKPEEAQRRRLDEQIKELQKQSIPPESLGGQAEVRSKLIDLTNERHRLALAVLRIRRTVAGLGQAYAELEQDREVAAALAALGPGHRLGPLGDGYKSEVRRLREYDKYMFTDWVPRFPMSGRVRIGGIVNDRTPVTFTWLGSYDPTTLTSSMAEAAGLLVPQDAPVVPLPVSRGRTVQTRQIEVPSMRFGGHRLEGLSVLVLPPEAEDLGAQIGLDAFAGYSVEEQADRLRLVITKD